MKAPLIPIYRTRLVRERRVAYGRVFGPMDTKPFLDTLFRYEPVEVFAVLLMDTAGQVTGAEIVSRGGLSSAIIEPRAVYRTAVLGNAASVVVAHNHPSGNLEPSAEDIAVTRQLVEAGRVMGIPLRDHIIWTSTEASDFTSLAERGLV